VLEPGEGVDTHYRVEERLSADASGEVYRAFDLRLARPVALRVLASANASSQELARFDREWQLLARLDHPNVVRIHWSGRHRNMSFLVMSLVERTSLKALLETRGRLEPAEVQSPLRQLATALTFLHRMGLVHRDVKPGNILVAADGRLTLVNLGLARTRQTQVTQAGVLCGTPGYVPPEQILAEEVDGRADVYALAVCAFQARTGRRPFDAPDPEALLRAHLTAPPPDIRTLRPELPDPTSAVFRRGLAARREDRYRTVVGFGDTAPDHAESAGLLGDPLLRQRMINY
jgi:serine/threonine protein kinase